MNDNFVEMQQQEELMELLKWDKKILQHDKSIISCPLCHGRNHGSNSFCLMCENVGKIKVKKR